MLVRHRARSLPDRPLAEGGIDGRLTVRGMNRVLPPPAGEPRPRDRTADFGHEQGLQTQAFSKAAEGIRTLDLLHGKQ